MGGNGVLRERKTRGQIQNRKRGKEKKEKREGQRVINGGRRGKERERSRVCT